MPKGSKRKKNQDVDVSRFKPLVEEALKAFGAHVAYAEAMSKAAVTVERKRSVWGVRTAVQNAEKEAREECEKKVFVCEVTSPCGTGSCPFAPEELSGIHIDSPGKKIRPSNSIMGPYGTENVVKFIHARRISTLTRSQEHEER